VGAVVITLAPCSCSRRCRNTSMCSRPRKLRAAAGRRLGFQQALCSRPCGASPVRQAREAASGRAPPTLTRDSSARYRSTYTPLPSARYRDLMRLVGSGRKVLGATRRCYCACLLCVCITSYIHLPKTHGRHTRLPCACRAHPQRKPAPSASLFSRLTPMLASVRHRRSIAAASASKSPPLVG